MHKPATIFRNESGAFDLPSIMIGVAVVAILTVGVLAAIFGVIPWSQDKAAQQDLDAVHTAQGAAFARDGGFIDRAGLAAAGLLVDDPDDALEIQASADGRKYVGVSTSATGKKFMISAEAPTSRPLTNQDKWPDGEPIDPSAPDAPVVEAGPADSSAILATYTCGPAELVITQAMQDHSDENIARKAAGEEFLAYEGGGWMIIVDTSTIDPNATGVVMTMDGKFSPSLENASNESGFAIVYSSSGMCMATMVVDGQVHADEGPASYSSYGDITTESYVQHGVGHRDGDLPTKVQRRGGKADVDYYMNGMTDGYHRLTGPAITGYDEFENVNEQYFYVNGKRINTFADWKEAGGTLEAWIRP